MSNATMKDASLSYQQQNIIQQAIVAAAQQRDEDDDGEDEDDEVTVEDDYSYSYNTNRTTSMDNETKNHGNNMVVMLQNKFTAMMEETKRQQQVAQQQFAEQIQRHEQSYATQLQHMEQSLAVQRQCRDEEIATLLRHIRQQEEEIRSIKDLTQKSHQQTTLEVQKLQVQLENITQSNTQCMEQTNLAQQNFIRARTELIDTVQHHQEQVAQFQNELDEQANEIQAVRADSNSDKEEMELMIQSWIAQVDQLNQHVQEQANEISSIKDELHIATQERETTRQSVQKLGATWETLFEHIVEQVQDQSAQHKNFVKDHEACHADLVSKIDARHVRFEDIIHSIQDRCNEQDTELQTVRDTMTEKCIADIATIQEQQKGFDIKIASLNDEIAKQHKDHERTRVDLNSLHTIVAKNAGEGICRLDAFTTKMDTHWNRQATVNQTIHTMLTGHDTRITELDTKCKEHTVSMDTVTQTIQQQGQRIDTMEHHHTDTQREMTKIIATHKMELDDLSNTVQTHYTDQQLVNSKVGDEIQTTKSSVTDLDQQTKQLSVALNNLTIRVDQHADDHVTARSAFEEGHKTLGQCIEDRIHEARNYVMEMKHQTESQITLTKDEILATIRDHDMNLSVHEAKLSTFGPQIQNLIHDVAEHGKQHGMADQARALIREDIQQIVSVMTAEDTKLRNEIQVQGTEFKDKMDALDAAFTTHTTTEHQELEARLVQDAEKVRVRHETAVQDITTNLTATQSKLSGLEERVDHHGTVHDEARTARSSMANELLELASGMKQQKDAIVGIMDIQMANLRSKQDGLSKQLTKQVADHTALKDRVERYNTAIHEKHDASVDEIHTKIETAQSELVTLSQKVDKHGDELNTSKEARGVIRTDLKKLMDTMQTQDGKLRRQIEETAVYIKEKKNVFKSMLATLEAKQTTTDGKVEQYNTAAKDDRDAMSLDIQTKFEAVKQDSLEQRQAIQGRVYASTKAMTDSHNALQKQLTDQHADGIAKVTTELHTAIAQLQADKYDLETQLGALRESLHATISDRIHSVEDKLTICNTQFENLFGQLKTTHTEHAATSKDQMDIFKEEMDRLTEKQIAQFEHLLMQVSQQAEELVSVKSSLPKTNVDEITARSVEQIQSLTDKFTQLMRDREDEATIQAQAEESKKADLQLWMGGVREQLKLVQTAIDQAKSSRMEEVSKQSQRDATSASMLSQVSEQLANTTSKMEVQAREIQAMKDDREQVQSKTMAQVEHLQRELQTVSNTMAQQAFEIQKAQEERDTLLRKLDASQTENNNLIAKVAQMQTQAREIQTMKKEHEQVQGKTTAQVEQLQRELQTVSDTMAQQAIEIRKAHEERATLLQKLDTTQTEANNLTAKVIEMQTHGREIQAMKDDHEQVQAATTAQVERLQRELQAVSATMAQQTIEIQKAHEERVTLLRKLDATQTEANNLTVKVVAMKDRQMKYKTDFRKRQMQLKALVGGGDESPTADVPRDLCFSIEEEEDESREATGSYHSFHTLEESGSRE